MQGGLTTCMELTANRRPFVYIPLRHHFEQKFHVPHRLDRYGAGRRIDYDEAADPDGLAEVIADEIGRTVDYLPVDTAAPRAPLPRSPSCCKRYAQHLSRRLMPCSGPSGCAASRPATEIWRARGSRPTRRRTRLSENRAR